MKEINRLVRHLVAPVTAWLVAEGHLPEYMQHDITEAATLAIALGVPLVLSWLRDRA